MAVRLVDLKRPEAGEEHGVCWFVHHGCQQGHALRGEMGPDVDQLRFNVGLVGYTMPMDIPFAVEAADGCRACGTFPSMWFRWTGQKVLWMPGEA